MWLLPCSNVAFAMQLCGFCHTMLRRSPLGLAKRTEYCKVPATICGRPNKKVSKRAVCVLVLFLSLRCGCMDV